MQAAERGLLVLAAAYRTMPCSSAARLLGLEGGGAWAGSCPRPLLACVSAAAGRGSRSAVLALEELQVGGGSDLVFRK